MSAVSEHPEWTLSAGDLRATVSPFGASLRRMWQEGSHGSRDLLWGYGGTGNKRGGQGDVLIPFPGRIRNGRYTFAGAEHQLPCNDKDGPNAIHGFLRTRVWDGDHDASTARFRTRIAASDHPGYPFDLDVVVGYELLPTGLAGAFVVRNAGDREAPVGVGFHPYLMAPPGADATSLHLPAGQVVEFDGLLPTGRVLPVPEGLDFRTPRPMGSLRLNHCFTQLERDRHGFARARVGDLTLWMDRAFSHVVVYTGDALGPNARKAIAVEPMTCATDAFNHPAWGLCVLAPGDAFSGTWGVTPAPPAHLTMRA